MKIKKIDVLKFRRGDGKAYVACRIHSDTGLFGDGEVAGITSSSGSFGTTVDLAKMIVNKDPLCTEAIWETMYKESFWGQNGGPMTFAGMSALDIALWDLKAKHFNVPVYVLLGGKTRDKLRCYASQLQNGWWPIGTIDGHKPCLNLDEYRAVAQIAMDEGYDAVKLDAYSYNSQGKRYDREDREGILKPWDVKDIEDRVRVTREVCGPNVDIIVENHSRIDMLGAFQVAEVLKKYNIMYFEEPNTSSPFTAELISRKIDMPIAAGERIYSRWQYIPYFEGRTIQVIQPDIGNCGGYTEVKKICDMAHAYDIVTQIHTCGSPLATNIAMQLEAVIPNFCIHEHHHCLRMKSMEGLTKYNLHPVNGYLTVPDAPGIGNEYTQKVYDQAESFACIEPN